MKDGNGFITKDELTQLMGDNVINDEVWIEILHEFDTNKDGKVNLKKYFEDRLLKYYL